MFNVLTVPTDTHIGILFKGGILTILLLFIIFLFVVLTQVRSMNKIVTQPYLYPILFVTALFLITLALALFVLSVIIL